MATLVGTGDPAGGSTAGSLRSDRRASRRAGRDRRRRYTLLGMVAAAAAVLLVLAAVAVPMLTGDDEGASTDGMTSGDVAARTSVLVQLTGAEQTAEAAALLSWDAGLSKGGALTVPTGLLVDVAGFGPLPLADSLLEAGGEESADALAATIRADVGGSWIVDESALSAMVEEVGGVTVEVDVDVTEQGADGSSVVVVPAGSQQLDGTQAAAFASFRGDGEDAFPQTERFGKVLQAVLAGLPQGAEAVSAVLVELGGGSDTTMDDAALARMLSDLGQATEAGQAAWHVLPTAVGPTPGTLVIDTAALDLMRVEAGLTG